MRFKLIRFSVEFKLDFEARKICESALDIFARLDHVQKNYKE
jgi:hypothetical protein